MTDAARLHDVATDDAVDPIREKLVASAAVVFAEKGYDGAGVAEIARRAGYTTGAIYGRFTGKAELLLAAIEARSENELDQLFNEHRFEGKVTDILTTVGSHLVTDEMGPESALLLEAFVAARRDPEVRRLMQGAPRPPRRPPRRPRRRGPGHRRHRPRASTPRRSCASATPSASASCSSGPSSSTCPRPARGRTSSPASSTRSTSTRPPIADTEPPNPRGTPEMTTNEEMLGRADVNDLEAILSITAKDVDEMVHAVKDNADALFTWNYEKGERPALNKLYEKAKGAQWNGETDLPWHLEVDIEKVAANAPRDQDVRPGVRRRPAPRAAARTTGATRSGTSSSSRSQNWTMSQFMHGEQGALVCTAKIVETVPWIDAKYYAATQVMDEARHVEVFAKYLDTKMNGHYPLNAHLGMLLDDIIQDSRWDMTYLGMQIMVEGLALAAFGFMHMLTEEPLLKQLLRYVMSDEARHVAFGVLSLKEYYGELTDAEMLERQQFAFEAAVRMRDRFLQQEVWERMGVDVRTMIKLQLENQGDKNEDPFQQLLFSKIVPNCKKLGLLDRNNGWLRTKFGEMGVIQFEDWADTGEEYDTMSLAAMANEQAGGAAVA